MWTSAIGITNAIRINHCNKLDLRFEVLKWLKIDDAVECSNDVSSAKEKLMMVKMNNINLFVEIELGIGKNTNNVLVVMRKSMVTEGKDWIRNNYGNAFLCVNDIEHESSVMLNK